MNWTRIILSGAGVFIFLTVVYVKYASASMQSPVVSGLTVVSNVPEFPSALLSVTLVLGLLGAVFLTRRMKQY